MPAHINSSPPIDVVITQECAEWPNGSDTITQEAVLRALHGGGYHEETEVSIVLADNAFVQVLNKNYRGKDKPTNVLSFPQDDDLMGSLGDIIFAFETVKAEAAEQNKNFNNHLAHLAVHGTLHLLGYDHMDAAEAEEMEALEIKILSGMNIPNPYELDDK